MQADIMKDIQQVTQLEAQLANSIWKKMKKKRSIILLKQCKKHNFVFWGLTVLYVHSPLQHLPQSLSSG